MTTRPRPRCYCGHPHAAHEHYRPGNDCGECGVARCHRYAPRDEPLPHTHTEAAAASDAHAFRNLAVLASLARSTVQRIAAARIPAPRRAPVTEYLEHRRAQNRKGGNRR